MRTFPTARWMLPTRVLEKMAPKMATPKEAPMERKKVVPEVAVPRSL